MADKMIFHKTGLTSGGAGCLDSISGANRGDTNPLQADDAAFVMVSSLLYAYLFDAASTAVESSPDIIRPDDIAVGSPGRWILQSVNPTAAQIAAIITGATNENTPLDADDFGFYKATVAALRKVTWANIKATLKAYFDGIYATGTIPTKAAYTDINTGTDDAKFLTSLALTESKPNVHGQTITAIRGTELAPAITEANWDTNVAGWVHPVVGGVLDKGSAGDYAEVRPTGATAIEANCLYELVVTIVNSPTTGTFVSSDINIFLGNSDWVLGLNPTSTGTYTCLIHTKDTTNITIAGADASRFGVSAISVKKLTEGNLVIAEGSIKTGAPSSESNWGTAATWKLGSVVNNEIEVEVGGDTVKRMLLTAAGIAAIPEASDNATAATAGVAVGGLYHTNANPAVVCIRTA
jgi:hypothetical protein